MRKKLITVAAMPLAQMVETIFRRDPGAFDQAAGQLDRGVRPDGYAGQVRPDVAAALRQLGSLARRQFGH